MRKLMPGARNVSTVVTMLIAPDKLPTPLTSSPMIQKSVAAPRAKVCSVSGA